MKHSISIRFWALIIASCCAFQAHAAEPNRKKVKTSTIKDANNLLLRSAFTGNLEKVKAALSIDADINTEDDHKHTALMRAASQKHKLVMEYLLDKNAQTINSQGISVYSRYPDALEIVEKPMETLRQINDSLPESYLPEEILYEVSGYLTKKTRDKSSLQDISNVKPIKKPKKLFQ